MAQEHKFSAVPLFAQRGDLVVLNFVSLEETEAVDKDPGEGATEVDEFVHGEGHDAGGQNIILHPGIPGSPEPFGHIELAIEFRDFLVLAPVGARGHGNVPGKVRQKDVGNRGKCAYIVVLKARVKEEEKEKEREVEATRTMSLKVPARECLK